MKPRRLCQTSFCFLALTVTAATARAQSTDAALQAATRRPVEISTFVSQGSTVSSKIGAAINFAWTSRASVEAEIGYRSSEIDALSSSVNLVYTLPRLGRVVPYLAAGAGLEKYATASTGPNNTIIAQSNTAFAINAGGGVKVPVTENWAFRTDARWFRGFGRNAQEHWRVYNGVTVGTGQR
jgi:opacity protein-like surface antigen